MRGEGWREREGNGRMGNDEIYCVDRGIPSCFNYRSRVASSDFLSLSFPLFLFSFDRGRQSRRLESQTIKFDLDSMLFFFLSFGTRFIFSLYKMYKLARSGKETTKIIL